MKNLLFLILLCATSSLATAQGFGRSLISGSASYSTKKTEYSPPGNHKDHHFTINPRVGFFVSSNWAVGLSAGYESSVSPYLIQIDDNSTTVIANHESHSYKVGPFVRYYKSIGNKAAFFGQVNANYQYIKFGYNALSDNFVYPSSTNKGGLINLMPGFVFFPTNTIGLELMAGNIGYSRMKEESEGSRTSSKSNAFNASFGLNNLSLGISLYLGRTAAE